MNKTFSAKPAQITRKWYVVDASELPLGRLAGEIAKLLIGKSKPSYTPHVDGGDYVIVVNSDRLVVTGKKMTDKIYFKYSGYPGGLRERTLSDQLERDSTKIVESAVRGMLPDNKLRDDRLSRLKIYKEANHQHEAQKPEPISFKRSN